MFQETLVPEPNNETDILRKVFDQQAASCGFDLGVGGVERGFTWWTRCTAVISALGRLRQEGLQFEASLGYRDHFRK